MDILMVMAMTLDGKIARSNRELVNWTGAADKRYFVRITRECGVMIMGSKTFDTIGKALPGRLSIVMTRNRDRKSDDPNLVFTDRTPAEIVKDLEAKGYTSAALIGGGIVNTLFAEANLITEYHVTVVPALFGKGLSLFDGNLDRTLEFMESREIEKGHILLKYRVKQ